MTPRLRLLSSISLLSLALAVALCIGASSSASVKAGGKVVSVSLTKTSFTAAQAATVKLKCKVSPKSQRLNYLVQMKKGAKWTVLRTISKKGSFKGSYSMTVKKLFGRKARKVGQYRVRISADSNSRTKTFRIRKAGFGNPDGGSGDLRVDTFNVASAAIGDNMLGDSASGEITVILPPSYSREPSRRYPVVYFLPGFGESESEISIWDTFARAAMASGHELIIAGVQGSNSLGGGFYVNSPVSGRFEDWVVSGAVSAVDARYRTIANRASRGLAGFSMGGFGAINLALRHPDVYSAVFAMSGGFLAPGALHGAMGTWDSSFRNAYGAAFAPDPSAPAPYARIPSFSGTAADNSVVALWESGFGDWATKLDAYSSKTDRLVAIRIEWGDNDSTNPWIPVGSAWLVQAMLAHGLPVESSHLPIDHVLPLTEVRSSLLPFFQRHLQF
jgi:pimeloyl-ACP methyl ester carboxylesterase